MIAAATFFFNPDVKNPLKASGLFYTKFPDAQKKLIKYRNNL